MDEYTRSKIAHLRNAGLVSGKNTGIGMHGGACPDWLLTEQKARAEARDKRQYADLRHTSAL